MIELATALYILGMILSLPASEYLISSDTEKDTKIIVVISFAIFWPMFAGIIAITLTYLFIKDRK